VMMIAMVFLNDRWRFTSNEFEHRVWGRTDDSIARAAKRVTASYPDVLELLICFSGTIMIKSPSGDATIRTIKNVPLLPLRMKKLTQILETTTITPGQLEEAETGDGGESSSL